MKYPIVRNFILLIGKILHTFVKKHYDERKGLFSLYLYLLFHYDS
jgi:hypothetical protein